jgi:hypothetical protein
MFTGFLEKIFCLHLQGLKGGQERNQQEADGMLDPGYLDGLLCEPDGGSAFLRNVDKQSVYTSLQPRI